MTIFEFDDYRAYLRHFIESLPKKGRGELKRIAEHLQVNTTLLSQILGGTRDFNPEQVYAISLYLQHTELEIEYFATLVQKERAGSHGLKEHLERKMKALRRDALKLGNRVVAEKTLSEENRAIFYSSWVYSAIHLFATIDSNGTSIEEIAKRFKLKRAKAVDIMQFLTRANLVDEVEGKYKTRVFSTFLPSGSPHLIKHHVNWRVKSIEKAESLAADEIMFSGQVSISKSDFSSIREQITKLIHDASMRVKNSDPDDLACLNIDWFWIE